jgi:hypothetical protein
MKTKFKECQGVKSCLEQMEKWQRRSLRWVNDTVKKLEAFKAEENPSEAQVNAWIADQGRGQKGKPLLDCFCRTLVEPLHMEINQVTHLAGLTCDCWLTIIDEAEKQAFFKVFGLFPSSLPILSHFHQVYQFSSFPFQSVVSKLNSKEHPDDYHPGVAAWLSEHFVKRMETQEKCVTKGKALPDDWRIPGVITEEETSRLRIIGKNAPPLSRVFLKLVTAERNRASGMIEEDQEKKIYYLRLCFVVILWSHFIKIGISFKNSSSKLTLPSQNSNYCQQDQVQG